VKRAERNFFVTIRWGQLTRGWNRVIFLPRKSKPVLSPKHPQIPDQWHCTYRWYNIERS
jgi:hypothetical protein